MSSVAGIGRKLSEPGNDQSSFSRLQLSLRRAFLTYGLPEALTLDHGTVFYDNTTPSPFPTRLHLWLLALGVQVRFTRKRCPTDHAIIERTRPFDDGSSTARTNLHIPYGLVDQPG
jgi:hypothetical protein